jgi:hypothetical protein
VPYEERIRRLDEVQPFAPSRAFIEQTFDFSRAGTVGAPPGRTRSRSRAMYEGYFSFDHYVRFTACSASKGCCWATSQVYGTIVQIPQGARTEAVHDDRVLPMINASTRARSTSGRVDEPGCAACRGDVRARACAP